MNTILKHQILVDFVYNKPYKEVYVALESLIEKFDSFVVCFTYKQISEIAGIDVEAVKKHIQLLENDKLIRKAEKVGWMKSVSNVYVVRTCYNFFSVGW